jgi:hypothetical protein
MGLFGDLYNSSAGWALPGGAIYKGYKAFTGAYDDQKSAANKAADQATAAGGAAKGTVMDAEKRAQGYLNPAAQAWQGMSGQLQGPGYLEQLYQQGMSSEPFQRASKAGLAQMQQAAAARGAFNSGGAQTAEGNYLSGMASNFYGQQAGLAGQAQAEKQGRLGQMFGSGLQLGQAQGGLAMDAGKTGAGFQLQGDMAAIEARLKAAGVDVERNRDLIQLILGGAKAAGGAMGGG